MFKPDPVIEGENQFLFDLLQPSSHPQYLWRGPAVASTLSL
jgi:hypothetical protein